MRASWTSPSSLEFSLRAASSDSRSSDADAVAIWLAGIDNGLPVPRLMPYEMVGGGEENMAGVGVVSRSKAELGDRRFGGCDDGGGVMEDGGGGELYFGLSMLLGADTGTLLVLKEGGGELGLATSIDVVGDLVAPFAMSESDGSVAWWG